MFLHLLAYSTWQLLLLLLRVTHARRARAHTARKHKNQKLRPNAAHLTCFGTFGSLVCSAVAICRSKHSGRALKQRVKSCLQSFTENSDWSAWSYGDAPNPRSPGWVSSVVSWIRCFPVESTQSRGRAVARQRLNIRWTAQCIVFLSIFFLAENDLSNCMRTHEQGKTTWQDRVRSLAYLSGN